MAMQWIDDVRQTAIIDEAEQLAMRHLDAGFEPIRARYAIIGFDVTAFATELLKFTEAARAARTAADTAQTVYEIESAEAREATAKADKWLDQLVAIARYARLSGHQLGPHLDRLFADLAAESWSKGIDSLLKGLDRLPVSGNLTEYGLPTDFLDRGREIAARMIAEKNDVVRAMNRRALQTAALRVALDQIVAAFERIDAARDAVMVITGEELPGLELTLVKGAAASKRPQPVPAVEPNGL